jgi:hypothetical protein
MEYALLEYATENIGDEIQSIAAKQYLPRVDRRIKRDYLSEYHGPESKIILNGWFSHIPENWPPSPDLTPLFVSFHINDNSLDHYTSEKSLNYFNRHAPIGCRDLRTAKILRDHGVNSYFSGCLTLTLSNSYTKTNGVIYIVDLDNRSLAAIPSDILQNSELLSHEPKATKRALESLAAWYLPSDILKFINPIYKKTIKKYVHSSSIMNAKMKIAQKYLNYYNRADLVITSRLHVALPCLAYETPVIFIHNDLADPRFGGLVKYLNAYTPESFEQMSDNIDYHNITNPGGVAKLAGQLKARCLEFIGQ